jgi:hypothetical protein
MPKCKICNAKFEPTYFLQKHCNNINCERQWKDTFLKKNSGIDKKHKPIKKVSDKRKLEQIIYNSERIKFLSLPENKICPITKKPTTDVHHKKGRIGDLFLDKKYWVALSRDGHKFVEENPEWAKENGHSLSRLAND